MLRIKETGREDLKNIQKLWADGEVMRYVGFSGGLFQSDEAMENWYANMDRQRPGTNHFSVYDGDLYCGECFYRIDEANKWAVLDIKLFPAGRGRGIGRAALSHAIAEAFKNGADRVWVDPNPENEKAIALYESLGMVRKPKPRELYDSDYPDTLYFELDRE